MSNTHLSLLENYSTVNTFMIYIYIHIISSIFFNLKPGFVGRKPRKPHQEQYRMVPEISAFPSSYFYQGARLGTRGGNTNHPCRPTYHCHCQVDCWMVRWFEVEGVVSWYLHFSSWTWNRWGWLRYLGGQGPGFIGGGSCVCVCVFFFPEKEKGWVVFFFFLLPLCWIVLSLFSGQ